MEAQSELQLLHDVQTPQNCQKMRWNLYRLLENGWPALSQNRLDFYILLCCLLLLAAGGLRCNRRCSSTYCNIAILEFCNIAILVLGYTRVSLVFIAIAADAREGLLSLLLLIPVLLRVRRQSGNCLGPAPACGAAAAAAGPAPFSSHDGVLVGQGHRSADPGGCHLRPPRRVHARDGGVFARFANKKKA